MKNKLNAIPARWITLAMLAGQIISPIVAKDIPAFPGAEGYGMSTLGGRGGKVIAVSNLNASGPGSLQAACDVKGPRIVIFKVAGTIDGNVAIRDGFITIAGQTAPGDGITIKGNLAIRASDVVVRYIRVRTDQNDDAIGSRYQKNLILDHISASWSSDEVMSVYHCENVTIQWCMITEACSKTHKFGGIWGSNHSTYHHNLFAHNISRNPRFASGAGFNDFRNNVIYNWQHQSVYGGEGHQVGNDHFDFFQGNLVANYYKPGPGTKEGAISRILDPSTRAGKDDAGKWWVSDNVMVGSPEVSSDNWKGVTKQDDFFRLDKPWPSMPIHQQTAEEAYEAVLKHVGCSMPARDSIDTRIISEVKDGTSSKGQNGFVLNQEEAGGWIELRTGTVPKDSDEDGMPDEWEKKYKLNPEDGSDNVKDNDGDGYTNIEEFLNSTDPTRHIDYTKPENNVSSLK